MSAPVHFNRPHPRARLALAIVSAAAIGLLWLPGFAGRPAVDATNVPAPAAVAEPASDQPPAPARPRPTPVLPAPQPEPTPPDFDA